jgi:hypothetical protein
MNIQVNYTHLMIQFFFSGTDMTLHNGVLNNHDVVAILIDRKLQALSGEFLPASVKIG